MTNTDESLGAAGIKGAPKPSPDPYWDLGTFHRPISTTSKLTQLWSDRALTWFWGFNQEEAEICANYALANDPTSPGAWWTLLMALGPNYAKLWRIHPPQQVLANVARVRQVIPLIRETYDRGSDADRALCEARLCVFPPESDTRTKGWTHDDDYSKWAVSYAEAMAKVYDRFPDDHDVAAVYAESIMALYRFKLYDLHTGEPTPGSTAPRAKVVLDKALAQDGGDHHPGLLHLYIHLCEMTRTPEMAIPAADKLLYLVPMASHLAHMPSHLDVLIGDYRRAVSCNTRAVAIDALYYAERGPYFGFAVLRLHNLLSLIYAAMLNGQYATCMRYTDEYETIVTDTYVRQLPDLLEAWPIRIHVLVRFGKWEEILALDMPQDRDLYCGRIPQYHYARGIAFSSTGRVKEATAEQAKLKETLQTVKPTRIIFPNPAVDVIRVGEAMLDGELEYRKGNYDAAYEHLRESIRRYDSLTYGEPWSWMQPVRHAYAALNLEQGNVQVALDTYEDDLGISDRLGRAFQHPNNVWALHGYHECLTKLGRTTEANIIQPQLRLALAVSDVEISSSCYCRLNVTKSDLVNGHAEKSDEQCCR